jgi:uncharacterized radical SAM protein YgiQ
MPLANYPLPMSLDEARRNFGWDEFDAVIVTGDAYVDHPSFGAALIGRWLERLGLRVGIIAQPDWRSPAAFAKLGRPRLFFGVTAGNLDSQLGARTIMRRPRREDRYSPDGVAGKRPEMATVVYCQRLREAFKQDCPPLVIGGLEASLRRISYYDYWSDKVKRPILLDAKADVLVFGQGELPLRQLVEALRSGAPLVGIPGTSVIAPAVHGEDSCACGARLGEPGHPASRSGLQTATAQTAGTHHSERRAVELPSFEDVSPMTDEGRRRFAEMFKLYYLNCDPVTGRPVMQRCGNRSVVVYPPSPPMTTKQLDNVYAVPFTRRPHPAYGAARIPAYDMIRDSVTTHRGCYAGCAFCALTCHQGPAVASRSEQNILEEVRIIAAQPGFTGTISDLGGPTANMFGTHCKLNRYRCAHRTCLAPDVCPNLNADHAPLIHLLAQARGVPGVKHVFVQSGIRFDLALCPGAGDYIEELAAHHVSGRLKIAPEHVSPDVLRLMRKPNMDVFRAFLRRYGEACRAAGKAQFTVEYFISGHPGCTLNHMVEMALFLKDQKLSPEQVQDFYPAPLTLGMAMWHCGVDPLTGEPVYCAKTEREKRLQRALLFCRDPEYWPDVREALRECGRKDLIGHGAECLVPPEKHGQPARAHYPGKAPPRVRRRG